MNVKFFIFVGTILTINNLQAILDGRSSILHVDTHYTFTNGEPALGNVYFHDGFSVPPTETILLKMDSGFVDGDVLLNGGTISLAQDVHFLDSGDITGSGFLDFNSNSLHYRGVNTSFLGRADYIKILTPGIMLGTPYSTLTLRNGFDLSSVDGNFLVSGGSVLISKNIFTSASFPAELRFRACYISSIGDLEFFNPQVTLRGFATLVGVNGLIKIRDLVINAGSSVIDSGTQLELENLRVDFENNYLTLRNTNINFTGDGSSIIRIGESLLGQGNLVLSGTNVFRSSTLNPLAIDSDLTVEFLSGARLQLASNTYLTIE